MNSEIKSRSLQVSKTSKVSSKKGVDPKQRRGHQKTNRKTNANFKLISSNKNDEIKQKEKLSNLSKTFNYKQKQPKVHYQFKGKNTKKQNRITKNQVCKVQNNVSNKENKIKEDFLQLNPPWKKDVKDHIDVKAIYQKYKNSVAKVFNVLDIFSRGSISEANISRWVPQAALYFLGSVFQKIRNERISMNFNQFEGECMKIYSKSSPQDILQFIHSIQKHRNFNDEKMSFDGEHKETIESQVEDRFIFAINNGDTSFRNLNMTEKSIPLRIVNNVYNLSSGGLESQGKPSSQRIPVSNSADWKKEKIHDCQKLDRIKVSPLTDINCFNNTLIQSSQIKKNYDNTKLMNHLENALIKEEEKGPECSSPFFKQFEQENQKKDIEVKQKPKIENDRIDKLSLRLEGYIKENAARIERSKNCRVQP